MPAPRVLILRAPGTNCDQETAFAFQQAGAQADVLHLNRLLERPRLAAEYQVLCIPGGFSYGDDLGAGRIFATQLRHHLADTLRQFQAQEKLVLGICNGFQVMVKAGILLTGGHDGAASLTWNDSGRFEDRWVHLECSGSKCVFLQGIERMYLPVAHAEGKFVVAEPALLRDLDDRGQLVLRYAAANGAPRGHELPYPANPNGSLDRVAGICDATGRVFGLMPHPERHIDFTQHPQWTRRDRHAPGDGLAVFENAVRFFI